MSIGGCAWQIHILWLALNTYRSFDQASTNLRHAGTARHETQRRGRARGGIERGCSAHPARGGARDVRLDGARGGEHAQGHGRGGLADERAAAIDGLARGSLKVERMSFLVFTQLVHHVRLV
jgi:hypothetical protein